MISLKTKMKKRFLNINYNNTETRINITDMVDLSELRRAVKEEFPNSLSAVDAPCIQLCNQQGAAIEKWASIESLDDDYFKESGSCLVVSTLEPAAKKQRIATTGVWMEEQTLIYSLEKGNLFFVNRINAVQQLQQIHQSKYNRASRGSGAEWIIPIADNVIGLGKSEFSKNYIVKCRESWPDEQRNEFQRTLCDCHTVYILFHKGALLEDDFDSVVSQFLVDSLAPMFEVEPTILEPTNLPKTVNDLLKKVAKAAGPLFIVLDEIGAAFEDDKLDDTQRRAQFLSFCDNVLGKWLSLKNIFFLLLGRGSFLWEFALHLRILLLVPFYS